MKIQDLSVCILDKQTLLYSHKWFGKIVKYGLKNSKILDEFEVPVYTPTFIVDYKQRMFVVYYNQ